MCAMRLWPSGPPPNWARAKTHPMQAHKKSTMGRTTVCVPIMGSGWVTTLSWTVLLVVVSLQLPDPARAAKRVPGRAQSDATHIHNIAALLQVSNFSSAKLAFTEAIDATNRDRNTKVTLEGIPMTLNASESHPTDYLEYFCNPIYYHNVTTFLAVGPQKIINILSIVTNYVGIPVVGYNTDTHQVAVQRVSEASIFLVICKSYQRTPGMSYTISDINLHVYTSRNGIYYDYKYIHGGVLFLLQLWSIRPYFRTEMESIGYRETFYFLVAEHKLFTYMESLFSEWHYTSHEQSYR